VDDAFTPRVRAGPLFEREWDAIVVGSGIGGLVCAALLALRASMRVLVLERHYEAGGLTQTFRRRRFAWDVGVHYLGDLGPSSVLRRLFDALTRKRLDFVRLPLRHDRVLAPGIDVRLGGDRAALAAQLREAAPGEERAIDRVLGEIDACARAAPAHFLGRMRGPDPIDASADRSPFFGWADRITADVVAASGASDRLAALLVYMWGNYGSPPERSSFAAHAIAAAHYFGGGFYPVGGGGRLARELARTIAESRGAVVVCAEVAQVSLDASGRACGVRLADGTELRARIVVSDAGARATFERLVPDGAPRVDEMRERVRAIGPSDAHVGLYLGLKKDPRELGLDGVNLWIGRDAIARSEAEAVRWAEGEREEPPGLFVSTASSQDPSFSERFPHRSTLMASVVLTDAPFAPWRGTGRGRRGEEYEARKRTLARGMTSLARRYLPIDEGDIEHVEVSTPLSTAHFAGHASGEGCGLDMTPRRFRLGPRPATPIPGLYLTGQDVWMCGVGGASFGGLLTACAITRRDLAAEMLRGM
jgi:all-trans-retinol 13,14-reductase